MADKVVTYNDKYEKPFGEQISSMCKLFNTDYFEIWIGDDSGFAITKPKCKIYDSDDGRENKLLDEFGLPLDRLGKLITERGGSCYSLSPEYYEDKTGAPYPEATANKHGLSSIVVFVLAPDDVKSRIHSGKFA